MPHRILVIEDDPDVAKLLALRLGAGGFEVRTVPDAPLAAKEAHEFKPDLVILDLMLPGGGVSILRSLRLSVETKDTPVIVLSAVREPEIKRTILEKGVEAYMEKPYDAQQLIDEIRRILRISQATDAPAPR